MAPNPHRWPGVYGVHDWAGSKRAQGHAELGEHSLSAIWRDEYNNNILINISIIIFILIIQCSAAKFWQVLEDCFEWKRLRNTVLEGSHGCCKNHLAIKCKTWYADGACLRGYFYASSFSSGRPKSQLEITAFVSYVFTVNIWITLDSSYTHCCIIRIIIYWG